MPNPYYNAPSNNVPLTTVRSANENADRRAVEAAFDRIPEQSDLQRNLYGVDQSSVATLYEIAVPYLSGNYREGQEITFEAIFASTGPASIQINGGPIVGLRDTGGNELTAGIIGAGQMVKAIYTSNGIFRLLNVVNVGSAAVNESANYNWTGVHDFSGATVNNIVNESTNYDWTGVHDFSQAPTINGEQVLYQTNLNQATINIFNANGSISVGPAAVGGLYLINSASPATFTLDSTTLASVEVGQTLSICQIGAGQVTLTPAGSTVISSENGLITNGQYAFATLIYVSTNNWIACGSLTSA